MSARGTTNRNDRGSAEQRRRRKAWLVHTYRADVDALIVSQAAGVVQYDATPANIRLAEHVADAWGPASFVIVPACRCFRCGALLTADTVTVDRIIPGCKGGTYRRDNIRPACGSCNSITGCEVRTYRPKVRRQATADA